MIVLQIALVLGMIAIIGGVIQAIVHAILSSKKTQKK